MTIRGHILVETEIARTQAVSRAMRGLQPATAQILAVDTITGPFDVIVLLEAEDIDRLGKAVTDEIQCVPGVQKTTTCLIVHEVDHVPATAGSNGQQALTN